ncbi:MAG: Rne/Rng family ribonuclease [Pseudonocardiaceae bacterium]|nr:Rne/Rng family ribonuclease [Pseudonocardiaceae bacterium]
MTSMDLPAGGAGGGTDVPNGADIAAGLPTKLRVHALAKLLSVSSKEVLSTLSDLGVAARSAHSSIDRETAVRAVQMLLPEPRGEQQPQRDEGRDVAGSGEVEDPGAPAVPLAPAFTPPAPVFRAPEPRAGGKAEGGKADGGADDATGERSQDDAAETDDAETDDAEADDVETDAARRRRRRGRRGRGRGKGGEAAEETSEDQQSDGDRAGSSGKGGEPAGAGSPSDGKQSDDTDTAPDSGSEGGDGDEGAAKRRRRRRRRKTGVDEDDPREDDPPNTVVHVRETQERSAEDEVTAVRGSTRLEAKRQRRRDGREAGRRRAPILSESEFLTRRESVERTMVVREHGDRTQIGVLEDGVLVEHFVTSTGSGSMVGNVYLGRVQNVLPSMEAAFVDIGRGRNAVLYAGEVDWDAAGLEGKSRRIEQALSSGDSVLVQVTKDPAGHKGARLTTQISLPGRFLVYVPGGRATGISRKLPDNERKRLKDTLKRIVPEDAGVIIRTASEGISEDELARDVRRLQAQWEVIQSKGEISGASLAEGKNSTGKNSGSKNSAPELLYEEPDLLVKVVRDLFTEDFGELVVQGDQAWTTVEGYVSHVAPELMSRVRRQPPNGDAFAEFRIDEQITKALDRKVWLPSGGYLILDRTEAMTVIDVNTGKYTGSGGNLEETVTRNNLEAAEEVIRQLRLRDIGGIIVIDFIDMVLESNRDLVLRRLTECLGRDRTRHQVAEVTSLGLVQMTRKRVGTGLLEAFSTQCEHCKGRGVHVSSELVEASRGNGEGSSATSAPSARRSRSRGRGSGTAPEPASVGDDQSSSKPSQSADQERSGGRSPEPAPEPAPQQEPAAEQAQPPARRTRRRRAASRPAGPPAAENQDGDAAGGRDSSTVPQAG